MARPLPSTSRPLSSTNRTQISLLVLASLSATNRAHADVQPVSVKTDVAYKTAIQFEDGDFALSRFSLKPEAKWRFGNHWRAEISAQIDIAHDRTGLGTLDNYSDLSRPLLATDDARIEIDRAELTWHSGATRLSIGKQVTAWGVLDGLQVTDRFDPVRRRDFLFTDIRPERIARWGVQARTDIAGWTVEGAIALDPTVSQQARLGDIYALSAPRFTGGLAIDGLSLDLQFTDRNDYLADATFGVRLRREVGANGLSLIALSGPDTDPILSFADLQPPELTAVQLDFIRRTLIGATWDRAAGPAVFRAEFAYIPDQPLNVLGDQPLAQDQSARVLAGLAVDWNGPLGLFVNAQIGVDHISDGDLVLPRPQTDTIATLRIQRSFQQSGWTVKTELIGSLNQGDGAVRPAISYAINDTVSFSIGSDIAFGERTGQFGQFRSANRIWTQIKASF